MFIRNEAFSCLMETIFRRFGSCISRYISREDVIASCAGDCNRELGDRDTQ
jgi:hypothetical protein